MTTGELIRKARKEAGLTQAQLAKKLDIPYQSIGQWERNVRNPKYDTLKKIANALDTEWTKLVPENTTIGVDEENTVMVSSSGGESVQEKAQEISEEKTHGHELKVGNTYFHGSVVISQLDEKPGKLKIVFKIDDERLEASDVTNLLDLFSGIAEMETVKVEGMQQLLDAVDVIRKRRETTTKDDKK